MERPELSISMHRAGTGETVLRLAGEIDMLTAGQLSAAVDTALGDGPSRLLLDLAGVTFCDSQGLGTLVVLSRKAASARCVLVLTNVAAFLLRVLDITGLRSALMIRNDAAPSLVTADEATGTATAKTADTRTGEGTGHPDEPGPPHTRTGEGTHRPDEPRPPYTRPRRPASETLRSRPWPAG